jgi:hypothetical protein
MKLDIAFPGNGLLTKGQFAANESSFIKVLNSMHIFSWLLSTGWYSRALSGEGGAIRRGCTSYTP